MQKKHWIPLAVLAAVILGAGHFLTGGDWYAARTLKKIFSNGDLSVAEAQRQFEEAKRGVFDAKHRAQQAHRRLAEAKRNEAARRRVAADSPASTGGEINGPLSPFERLRQPSNVVDVTAAPPRVDNWGFEIVDEPDASGAT